MEQVINVATIEPNDVDKVWPLVREDLAVAVEQSQGEIGLPDIHVALLTGLMRLWISYNSDGTVRSSAVVEIRVTPQKRICFILFAAGGTLNDWDYGSEVIEQWALEQGADVIQAFARKGVVRRFEHLGYQPVYTVVQKDLTQRRLH